jgi:hypothetical protein
MEMERRLVLQPPRRLDRMVGPPDRRSHVRPHPETLVLDLPSICFPSAYWHEHSASGKAIRGCEPIGEAQLKRILSIIGGLFLVLVLAVAGLVGYVAYQGRGMDASSKAYVEESLPAIISTWSKDELLERSSPQLQKIIDEKPEQLDQLFQKLSQLGPMQSFGEVKGDSNISYTTQNGKVITAAYAVTAKFKNGEGRVTARLIQPPAGQWQFLQFNVNSPLFLQ